MFTKTVIAAFILAATAASLPVKAFAGPASQQTQTGNEPYYQYRASQNHDGGTGN